MPDTLEPLVQYFDSTYVTGTYRFVRRPPPATSVFRRSPPLFPVDTWNVFDATLMGQSRTNNLCESWNSGFAKTVGHSHPSVWVLIDALRKDAVLAATDILRDAHGQPPKKRINRGTRVLQARLQRICTARRDNVKTIAETLNAAAHAIRFA